MESTKTAALETPSNASGFSASSPYFDDSNVDNLAKKHALEVGSKNETKNGSRNNSSSAVADCDEDGGSEDGGFVSGEEDFETASENPVVIDSEEKAADREKKPVVVEPSSRGDDGLRGNLAGGSVKKTEIKGASTDKDEDMNGIGSREIASSGRPAPKQKDEVFNGEQSVETEKPSEMAEVDAKDPVPVEIDALVKLNSGENVNLGEALDERTVEVESKDPVPVANDAPAKLDAGANVGPGEVVDEKMEGVEKQKSGLVSDGEQVAEAREPSGVDDVKGEWVEFTDGGDSIVDKGNVDTLNSGTTVVGDAEAIEDTETKDAEVAVDQGMSLENGYNRLSDKTEKVVETESKQAEADSEQNSEAVTGKNVETGEVKSDEVVDGDVLVKDDSSDVGNVVVHNKEKADREIEMEGEFEAKKPELEEEKAVDEAEHMSSAKPDRENENGSHAADSVPEPSQTDAAHDSENGENDKTPMITHSNKLEEDEPNVEDTAEAEDKKNPIANEEGEVEGSDGETEGMIFGSSEAAKQFLEDLEKASGVDSSSGAGGSRDHSQRIDAQIVTDSDEEGDDTDEEGEGKELFDSAALAALLKAATGAESDGSGSITITSEDGSKLFSVERPAGLGSSLRSLRPGPGPGPGPRSNRTNLFTPSSLTTGGENETNLSEEEKKKLEKLQQLRVKFLRLVQRLGHSPEDSIAAQVLYRLALVAGRQSGQIFSLDGAKRTATQLEAEERDNLDFSLNILVLGKTGVGKSATINSIFGEVKTVIDTFEPGTTSVKEIVGIVDGVKIRVIDTPGLKSSGMEQGSNRKVLSYIKKFTKRCPPDIVLYVDRLDSQTRDLNDLPLLRSIASVLGPSIWRSAIVTLTHAASAPPDGPSGSPLSYEVFVAQRSHIVQQLIGQAVGDLRLMNPSLMNPVSLVENHPACRKNRDGQKVLPNGQTWRPQLLLLCYSMKILSEASSLSKPQDPFDHKKLFGFRVRSPPLPYLLSWLLQSRTHPKLANDQGGDNGDSDIELADLSDSDQEEDDEYDQLPPFKPLRKAQLAKLSKEQMKAYFDEYDYRVKLLQKKQWREEVRRMKEMKKNKGKLPTEEHGYLGEDADQENGAPAAVPVPLPDMALPPSFDSDNPGYRYRFLEPTSQFLARPVLDTHGWDHDCGYDGVNVEQSLAIASQFPAAITVQVTKDKKEFNLHLDSSVAAKHGDNGSSMLGFDIQNVGKQLAYILRGETKLKNMKRNKMAAGMSVTFLGENVATGLKLEDQIALGKRLVLVGSTGTVRSQGDAAYGANLEVRLREADFPIGQDQSSLGLSLVKWRGDLALGANLQSQISVGRNSKIAVRAGLNNKLSGQITLRTSTSDQFQIALLGILPIAMSIFKSIRPSVSDDKYSMY